MAEEILQHEAAHARARIDNCQDEQRFEHDGEVIPEAEDGIASAAAGEDVGHAEGERGCAAGASEKSHFARVMSHIRHLLHGDGEAPAGDRLHGGIGCLADDACG